MTDQGTRLRQYVNLFLENRPLFYSFIRPQEALCFESYAKDRIPPTLDFGCGDGFFSRVTFGEYQVNLGVDVEDGVFEPIEKPAYNSRMTTDGETISLESSSIGTVISNSVLEHVEHLDQCVAEIHRVLKPHGYFFTSVMTDNWDHNLVGRHIFGARYSRYLKKRQIHNNLLSLAEWSNLFEQKGFTIREVIAYLPPSVSRLLELTHYLSISSLLTKRIFGRWVLIKGWHRAIGLDRWITRKISDSFGCNLNQSSALFFVLQKQL